MNRTPPARSTTSWTRRVTLVCALVLLAAAGAASGRELLASSSSVAAAPFGVLHNEHRGAVGEADGAVPDQVSVFDDKTPAVANLDAALLAALRRAATRAADDGVEIYVNSGWRSAAYQDQLQRDAVADYGSEQEAARWVASADTSPHVSGEAVDIGHSEATGWLSEHGADYGLCQIYVNVPWHYELRPEAADQGCPSMYADPTQDPRMQQ